ncbi:MAG: hypothetical protein J6328_03365 [Bacilli bacterium]|nr:hypothetical protein [Bacilli bacterium]
MPNNLRHHSQYIIIGGALAIVVSLIYALLGAQLEEAKIISFVTLGLGGASIILTLIDFLYAKLAKKKSPLPILSLSFIASLMLIVICGFYFNMPVKERSSWNTLLVLSSIVIIGFAALGGVGTYVSYLMGRAEKVIEDEFINEDGEPLQQGDVPYSKRGKTSTENAIEVEAVDVEK